ncbi:MAG: DEAD/DEAH box helicase [Polyangiales bacterium]
MASREQAKKLLDLAEPLVDQLVEHDPAARNAIYEALDAPVTYVTSPSFDEKWRLTATIRSVDGRALHRPIVGVLPAGTPDLGCSCASGGFCSHMAMLLVDIAANEKLREALRKEESTAELLDTVEPARKVFRERFDRSRILRNWLPPEAKRVEGPFELFLQVEVIDNAVAVAPECIFELRVRPESSRVLIDPDELGTTRLPEPMGTALRLCQPLTRGRKGFVVRGPNASVVLNLLRNTPMKREADSAPVLWGSRPLRLHIARSKWSTEELRRIASGAKARDAALIPADEERVDALEARWISDDKSVNLPMREGVLVQGAYAFVWHAASQTLHPISSDVDLDAAVKLQKRPAVPLPYGDPAELYKTLRERTRNRSVTLPAPETFGLPARERPLLLARFSGDPLSVNVELEARYRLDFMRVTPAAPDNPPTWRDVDLEQAAARKLESVGLVWEPGVKMFRVEGEPAAKFWAEGIAKLRELGEPEIELQVPASLERATSRRRLQSRVRVSMDGDWIKGDVRFDAGDKTVDLAKLRSALAGGAKWIALDDGSLAEITRDVADAVRELEDISDASGHVEVTRLSVGRVERLAGMDPDAVIDEGLRAFRESVKAMHVKEGEVPKGLKAELRPYQRQALGWLQFLTELRAGGILADDMGLGKTLTTLALLQWRKERAEGETKPSLVVAPTSVITNWLREASRFTPELRVVLLHGDRRIERQALARRADLVITSYGVLRSDIDFLSTIDWRIVATDEAQTIKNAGSNTSESARRLRAEQRLALSGTPVENRLGELWAIMDFVNPKLLGTLRDFENRFEAPITHDGDALAAARLRSVVRPFVLRRTKREVLTELPPKQEVTRVIALSPGQRKLYDAMAAILRDEVGREVKEKGTGRSAFHVLTALLRLRQMSCDPRLVDAGADPTLSAKREAFLDLVRQLRDEGRRALVFSGFRQLLELWRGDLDKEGITYEYLDGTTSDRDARVHRFQSGTATLFLISLKAGGTGLNLTAADTVIHVDPWWNPAVEEQATDRAHRMGQTRSVTVYRMVAEGTVEEKIQLLKARKRDLADAVVREDQGALRGLSEDDVRMLLGELGEEGTSDPAIVAASEAAEREAETSVARSEPAPALSEADGAVSEPLIAEASKALSMSEAETSVSEPLIPEPEPAALDAKREAPMSAMASAMAGALGRSEAKREEEPQSRPEKTRETVVEKPSVSRERPAKSEVDSKPKAAAPKADGEFVSGPMVERAQKSATAWMARTGQSSKELAARVGWSGSHVDQLVAGRKKYIPAAVAAALVALDREK